MKIICGVPGCKSPLITEHDDAEEAAEIAEYDLGANYSSESGEWTCDTCLREEMAYWASQVPSLRAEAEMREQTDDPIAYWYKCKG